MAALPLHHRETLFLASIPTNLAFQRVESSGFQPFFVITRDIKVPVRHLNA
jgi:hypothetical protein